MKTTFFRPGKGYFPHITRKFTAWIKIVPPFLVFLLVVSLIFSFSTLYSRFFSKNVLGSSSFIAAVGDLQAKREEQVRLYEYWKQVVEEKPDYVAAYLYLIPLAQSLRKDEEAELFRSKVLELDPNTRMTY